MSSLNIYDFFGLLYLINKANYTFGGRTKLQKMIMLGKKEFKYPFTFDFVRYQYGPFSFLLFNIISNLVVSGILEEHEIYSPIGRECRYKLTSSGKEFLESISSKIKQSEKKKLDNLWLKYRYYGTDRIVIRAKEVFGW